MSGCIFGKATQPVDDAADAGGDSATDVSHTDGDMISPTDQSSGDLPGEDATTEDFGTDTDMATPTTTLVVTHKDDVVDDDGCTPDHCSLREAVAEADSRAGQGELPAIGFELVEDSDHISNGIPYYFIGLEQTLEIPSEMIIAGPDPAASRLVITADVGLDGSAPLVQISGNATLRRLRFFGTLDSPVLETMGETVRLDDLILLGGASGLLIRAGHVEGTGLGVGAPATRARLERFAGNRTGVFVGPQGELTLRESTVAGNQGHGIVVAPGDGPVELVENFVGMQQSAPDRYSNGGHGMLLQRGSVSVLRNLVSNNALSGIVVDAPRDGGELAIRGNQIGAESGNGGVGIDVVSGGAVVIGNDRPDGDCTRENGCNIIVNNGRMGIWVGGAAGVEVIGNFVGEHPQTGAAGNGRHGIVVSDPGFVEVDDGEACRSGGDCQSGICHPEELDLVTGTSVNRGGECVATCPTNSTCDEEPRALPGDVVIGAAATPDMPPATCAGSCNVISANTSLGIWAGAVEGAFQLNGNFVGLASNGVQPLANDAGIAVERSGMGAEVVGNIVAAAPGVGITVDGDYITLQRNWIGLDANGEDPNAQMGVGLPGIRVQVPDGIIQENVIAGGDSYGLEILSTSNFAGRIVGNRIGMTASGDERAPNDGNAGMRVGGCDGCIVEGNYIAASTGGPGMVLGHPNPEKDFVGTVRNNFVGMLFDTTPAGNLGRAMVAARVRGSRIEDNYFGHSTPSTDGLRLGVELRRSIDTAIVNNTFVDLATGIDAQNGTSFTVWDGNEFDQIATQPIRLASDPNDVALGDTDTGPNHLLDAPQWLENPTPNGGGHLARLDRSVRGARIELYASDGNNDAVFIEFCEAGPFAVTSTHIDCTSQNWTTRSGLLATQSARRAVVGFQAAGEAEATIAFGGTSYQIDPAPGATPEIVAANFATALENTLPSETFVIATTPDCAVFDFAACVDLTLPFGASVSNLVNAEVVGGHITSQMSEYRSVP